MNAKTTPKDFFLHLGAVIALYSSAIALMNLVFTIADSLLPDSLSGYPFTGSIVWPISILIVLVPILYVLEYLIARDIVRMPEKRTIWVRRWRIYLTLFLTGATIAGDLIALINTYLNGEVSGRFIAKIIIVFAVAAIVFAHYLLDKMGDVGKGMKGKKALAWTGGVLAVAAIVGGFVIVGSPATQRAIRFDSERVDDLTTLQWQIISYWQDKGTLPPTLQALNDPLSNFSVPMDPETQAMYGYSLTGPAAFSLCATFDRAGSSNANSLAPVPEAAMDASAGASTDSTDSWTHPAGQACFARTIDPTRYPPNIKSSTN